MCSVGRYKDGNTRPKLMTLPEEIFREIFRYLYVETLCCSLRKVCRKIQFFVDRYLKVGRTYNLVSRQGGSESEAIEYIQIVNNGIAIVWEPTSYIPYPSFILLTDKNWDKYDQRLVDKVIYTTLGEKIGFHFSESGKCMIYRYNPGTDRWKKLFEYFRPFRCSCYVESLHHCVAILSLEESPYYFEKHGNFSPKYSIEAIENTT